MKRILGLDLGSNSIGWAVAIRKSDREESGVNECIEASGSRIIPMDAAIQGDFEKGNSVSQTAERTSYRGIRRLRERYLLRRERLNRVLDVMGFLPNHYAAALTRYGKFKAADGCKLAWQRMMTENMGLCSMTRMLRCLQISNDVRANGLVMEDLCRMTGRFIICAGRL